MTKKIIWRLREQPTAESLQGLVTKSILTKEEAREILFSSETEEDRDKKSLESEIKFLRELVEKLSKSRSEIVTIIKEVEKPTYYKEPYWRIYNTWCGLGTNAINDRMNGTIYADATMSSNFSDIKTF